MSRHAVLLGRHDLTLDAKNRLLIPSNVKRQLLSDRDGEGFYALIGKNGKPWLYTKAYYEELVSPPMGGLTPNDDLLLYDELYFGMTEFLEWDKTNRILLPEELLKQAGIEREVTMVGVRNHLQLWDRTEYEAHRKDLLAKRAEIEARAEAARKQGNTGL